jgi:hypothetical protein
LVLCAVGRITIQFDLVGLVALRLIFLLLVSKKGR